jgi:hypothetical protein
MIVKDAWLSPYNPHGWEECAKPGEQVVRKFIDGKDRLFIGSILGDDEKHGDCEVSYEFISGWIKV